MKTDLEKYIQIFERFLSLAQEEGRRSLNHLKLMKLLWAADRYHLRQFGRTISGDTYVAMKNGPVASEGLDVIRESPSGFSTLSEEEREFVSRFIIFGQNEVSLKSSCGDDLLSPSEKMMVDKAWESFKDFEPFVLANEVTHSYPEWAKFVGFFEKPQNIRLRQKMSLEDFFLNPEQDDFFTQDPEVLAAARDIYILNHS